MRGERLQDGGRDCARAEGEGQGEGGQRQQRQAGAGGGGSSTESFGKRVGEEDVWPPYVLVLLWRDRNLIAPAVLARVRPCEARIVPALPQVANDLVVLALLIKVINLTGEWGWWWWVEFAAVSCLV